MAIDLNRAEQLLCEHNQPDVLRHWDTLDSNKQTELLRQIESIDFDNVERMRALLSTSDSDVGSKEIIPSPVISLSEQQTGDATLTGEQALRDRSVGIIVVAGGQGSRLGFDGPKGVFPVGPITNASLFEIHSAKVRALEEKYQTHVPLYIMTSQANDKPTRDFFEKNDYFGLTPNRVKFFSQGMWPGLWKDGSIILDEPGHIFMSPDGHGGILDALRVNGMLDDMRGRGIKTLFFFQVDNPLVEIAHPNFIGLHLQKKAEMSIKVCSKRDPYEGLGVVIDRDEQSIIIEYTELTDEQKTRLTPEGLLYLRFGSVAIHAFSFDFLEKEANAQLPLHIAHKKIPYCDKNGNVTVPDDPNGYKFEKFIFDVVPDAERSINIEFARENEFSPVKNAQGNDSPATTRRDIMLKFARWLTECGVTVPLDVSGNPVYKIEIDPCFALGPDDLREKLPPDFEITGDTLLK